MDELLSRCLSILRQRRVDAYLVGGSVRDQLLKRPSHDLDFVVPHDALRLARVMANELGGAFYALDVERETGRIVLPTRDVVDIALLRGGSIETDLAARDFTINALARPIADLTQLIDPHGGAADLRAKRLRAVSEHTFSADPVRLLRALRQSREFNFAIESQTAAWMERDAHLLSHTSDERVRDELVRMLQSHDDIQHLAAMQRAGFLTRVLPHADWNDSIHQTLQRLNNVKTVLLQGARERATKQLGLSAAQLDVLMEHLAEPLSDNRTRLTIAQLATLYTREPDAEADMRQLKFSRSEIGYVRALVRHHHTLDALPAKPAALDAHRFFRDSDGVGVGVLYLALAQPREAHTAVVHAKLAALLRYYGEQYEHVVAPRPLLNGAQLAERVGLRGPQIGLALRALLEAQVRGAVHTSEDALHFVQSNFPPAEEPHGN